MNEPMSYAVKELGSTPQVSSAHHLKVHKDCISSEARHIIAFFEHSHDSVLGVVYRPEFEARLHRFFEENHAHDDDVAWYALRNAVYATGCRCAASVENQKDFVEVQQESVQYFHNALSVQSDLLYMPSGLMAIQALVTMVSVLTFQICCGY